MVAVREKVVKATFRNVLGVLFMILILVSDQIYSDLNEIMAQSS